MKSRDPEVLEGLRLRYLKGYLVGVYTFMILWLARYFFRQSGLNSQPIGLTVLAGLILTAAVYGYYMLRLAHLNSSVSSDPEISSALNNELYQHYALKSWKAAFIAAIGTNLFFALVSFFYPVVDLMFVALTAIVAGACAYLTALYRMYRTA